MGSLYVRPFRGVTVYNTAGQTITTAVATSVLFGAEEVDTDGFHDTSTNTERLTVPTGLSGRYFFEACASFAAGGGTRRGLRVRKNNTTIVRRLDLPPVSGNPTVISLSGFIDLTAGNYINLHVTHDHGSDLALDGGITNSAGTTAYAAFSMWLVG